MAGTHVTTVVSTEAFALHEVSTRRDGIAWESEATACDTPHSMLMWISGRDPAATDTALAADPSIASYTRVTDRSERRLYRLKWADTAGITTLVQEVRDREGTIRSATGTAGEWTLTFLFPTRDALSPVFESCRADDIQIEVTAIHELTEGQRTPLPLTQPQYEALQAAYEHGYFEIPRQTTLADLADTLDISHQSLSERLRRAQHALLDQTVLTDLPETTTVASQTDQERTTDSVLSLN